MITEDIKMNDDGSISEKLSSILKPVGKIIISYGFEPETKETIFGLKMFSVQKFNEKLVPVIEELVSLKTKSKINDKVPAGFIFPIIDQHLGYEGRHSLIITDDGSCLIYKEHKEGNSIIKKLPNLKKALDYISNNLFYFEI